MTHQDAPLRLAIFDMDGTLIDSGDLICGAMRAAFVGEGLPPPDDRATRRIVGLELYEAVHRLAPDLEPARIRRLGDAYKAAFAAERENHASAAGAPLYDGARSTLEQLAQDDFLLLGIATGKSRPGLERNLDAHGLRAFFTTTQTCTEAPGKPAPGMIENCLRETGVAPSRAVMIGDTVFDMEMGRNAGIRAIGVSWGYHEPNELRGAGAEIVLTRFDDLAPALATIWSGK